MATEYTKLELMKMVRQAKRAHLTCASYSRLNKGQLYNHAVEIGLIEGKAKPPTAPIKQNLKDLLNKAQEMEFASMNGKGKKNSFIRRVNRVLLMNDAELTDDIVSKLVIDYKKLSSFS